MKTISIIFSSLLIFNWGQAQFQSIDSLKLLLEQNTGLERDVDLLNEIAYSFNQISLDSTFDYASDALALAKQIEYPSGIARALNLQGTKFLQNKDHDKSLSLNYEALNLVENKADYGLIGKINNSIAINYYHLGDQENSLIHFRNAKDQSMLAKDTSVGIIIGSNIGYLHLQNDELELAELYLEEGSIKH